MERRTFIGQGLKGIMAVQLMKPLRALGDTALNKTGFAYDERCLLHPHSPEVPERVIKIRETLANNGLLDKLILTPPLVDVNSWIRRIHTDEHIAAILAIENTGVSAMAAVEGALGAVKAVSEGACKNAFCDLRPPGHHAHNTGMEEGFCFFNNAAIAARYAQEALGHAKILIIDWDYHHGNSTQDAFYSDPTVLFFSTHNWHAYPGTGDPAMTGEGEGLGYNINVHLDCGATDDDMLSAWNTLLIPKVETFRPDFIFISAGFDSRINDTLGCFQITDSGYARMTQLAMRMADTWCNGRLVSLLEGGYNVDGVASAGLAHISTLLGQEIALENIPSETDKSAPFIRQGCLVLPAQQAKPISAAALFSASGKKVRDVPVTGNRKIPLILSGMASGHYYVRIKYASGKPRILPFNYLD
jgi:acetoin utilization deacetylase AcuC-like enzyme